ncbi:unnamed protein product, partial [Ilex paraguariensis]
REGGEHGIHGNSFVLAFLPEPAFSGDSPEGLFDNNDKKKKKKDVFSPHDHSL